MHSRLRSLLPCCALLAMLPLAGCQPGANEGAYCGFIARVMGADEYSCYYGYGPPEGLMRQLYHEYSALSASAAGDPLAPAPPDARAFVLRRLEQLHRPDVIAQITTPARR